MVHLVRVTSSTAAITTLWSLLLLKRAGIKSRSSWCSALLRELHPLSANLTATPASIIDFKVLDKEEFQVMKVKNNYTATS